MTSEIVERLAKQSFRRVSRDAVWTLVLHAGLTRDQLTRWKRSKHQMQLGVRLVPLLDRPLQDWDRYQLSDEELAILREMTVTDYPDRSYLPIRGRKELAVDGKDMIRLGLRKQHIKEALLLHLDYSVVIRSCPNDRTVLMKEVERWHTQSENKS
jgi:tRNA nucleotidyltransferase (CCA-adding enzyme)